MNTVEENLKELMSLEDVAAFNVVQALWKKYIGAYQIGDYARAACAVLGIELEGERDV